MNKQSANAPIRERQYLAKGVDDGSSSDTEESDNTGLPVTFQTIDPLPFTMECVSIRQDEAESLNLGHEENCVETAAGTSHRNGQLLQLIQGNIQN